MQALCEALTSHPTLTEADLADNELSNIPLECQLQLGRRARTLRLELRGNPLASPPLGSRGTADELCEYP